MARVATPLLLGALLGAAPPHQPEPQSRPRQGTAVSPTPGRTTALERHGITWTLAGDPATGTFCNGDPWVVGPARIVAIAPVCTTTADRTRHGATIDPDPAQMRHGYDSKLFGQWSKEHYDERCNVALAIARGEPCTLQPGQSLVSVQSAADDAGDAPQLEVAAVLTCVATAPAKDAFRPPYCRATADQKAVRHREQDLDWQALAELDPVLDMPDVEAFAARFDKLWLDHFPSWVGRFAHPRQAMPDYGRDLAAVAGSAALLLNCKLPKAKKRDLLVRFVQLGIDLHACVRAGGRWAGNGGHGSGRKFPILFAGALLRDEAMLAIGRDYPSSRLRKDTKGTAFFGEDSQTFVVQETAPGEFNWGLGGYGKEHVGMAEWGFMHTEAPEQDNAGWDSNPYRRCCSANCWLGSCLAARAMGLVQAWHHEPFFAYVDRYMATERRPEWRAWVRWHAVLWERERAKY